MNPLGKWMDAERRRMGISWEAFSHLISADVSYVSRLAHGARYPSLSFVEDVIAALKLEPLQAHRLYIVAGFVPPGWEGLGNEPELMALARALADPQILPAQRLLIRGLLVEANIMLEGTIHDQHTPA